MWNGYIVEEVFDDVPEIPVAFQDSPLSNDLLVHDDDALFKPLLYGNVNFLKELLDY